MAKQSFKIAAKTPSVITLTDAAGAEVRVGLNKQPLEFLRISKMALGADVDLNVETSSEGRLMCISWAKTDKALVNALELQARMTKALGTTAHYTRMAEAEVTAD